MKNLLFFLLFLSSQLTFAQNINRDAAIQKALYEYIVPATLDHSVTAFVTKTPLKPGDIIRPFIDGAEKRITSSTWFVWINDNSDAYFSHSTRYLFIDASSGAVELTYEDWWPELNGESIFMSEADRNDLDLIFFSDAHRTTPDK